MIQLKPHEEILQVVRESLVPHSGKFFLLGIWFLLPFFLLFPLLNGGTIGMVTFGLLFVFSTGFLWRASRSWAYTLLIITDKRVIDIDQHGFFDRTVTEIIYDRIDEVTYRTKGIIETVFQYGTIRLHADGTAADIEFVRVKRPARIHNLINDLRHQRHD